MYTRHVLVEIGGDILDNGAPSEIWSTGVRCQGLNNSGWVTNSDALLAPVGDALLTWWNKPASGMSARHSLRYLKINNINTDGTYHLPVTSVREFPSTTLGPNASGIPAFCSLAWTLETGFERGRAHRGRMYPPNPTYIPLGNQVQLSAAVACRDAGYDFLHSVIRNASYGAPTEDGMNACVYSKLDGTFRGVTGVTVDTVYDVQRRRKNRDRGVRSSISANPNSA